MVVNAFIMNANVPQLHAGQDFNHRTSTEEQLFKSLICCQQNTETRLAG
jgi:hypothetical protein